MGAGMALLAVVGLLAGLALVPWLIQHGWNYVGSRHGWRPIGFWEAAIGWYVLATLFGCARSSKS